MDLSSICISVQVGLVLTVSSNRAEVFNEFMSSVWLDTKRATDKLGREAQLIKCPTLSMVVSLVKRARPNWKTGKLGRPEIIRQCSRSVEEK